MTTMHSGESIRSLEGQNEWRSVCGFRRDLVAPGEDPRVCFHYMRIADSARHVHRETTEYYFVVEGIGEVELDGELYAVRKGDMAVIAPGVWHTSRPASDRGDFHVLIAAVPGPRSDGVPDIEFE